jgi:hypothetical protein
LDQTGWSVGEDLIEYQLRSVALSSL